MFFSSKLNKFKNLNHCFFSRKNGVSKGYYESLNCGLGSKDEKKNVLKNINIVKEKISKKNKSLITLNQIHSNTVIHFKNEQDIKNKITGDAVLSEVKYFGIGILTADCAPILFYDFNKKIIGCAHSGWRGALNGLIKNTVEKFKELNSNVDDIIAVVGPCLEKNSYEVKSDFIKNFIENDIKNKIFFKEKNNTKHFFDLRGFVNKQILNSGVKNIDNIEMDTFSNKDYFYSYRRSCINKELDYGRCISVIMMT